MEIILYWLNYFDPNNRAEWYKQQKSPEESPFRTSSSLDTTLKTKESDFKPPRHAGISGDVKWGLSYNTMKDLPGGDMTPLIPLPHLLVPLVPTGVYDEPKVSIEPPVCCCTGALIPA